MKFINILSNILNENKQTKFSFLFDKYVGQQKPKAKPDPTKVPFEVFKEIIKYDPTTRYSEELEFETLTPQEMNDKVKVGAYSEWLLKNYLKPDFEGMENMDVNSSAYKAGIKEYQRLFIEDLFKVRDNIIEFNKIKQNLPVEERDIKNYTPKSLFNKLDEYEKSLSPEYKEKREKKEKKQIIRQEREGFSHPGGKIIFTGNRYTVVKIEDGPFGQEAASWYGGYYDYKNGESNWCTSPPESSHYKGYIKDGPLYVILANNDNGKIGKRTGLPQERFQFHFPSNQFMNRADHSINKNEDGFDGLVDFLRNGDEGLAEIFKEEFAKGLVKTSGSEQLIVNYPNDASGKFVALYGFEELFESLPDTLAFIQIKNSSKENIALDIPKSIGKFTKLKALLLENIVKSIPDTICQCESLVFLNLQNNAKLTKLPDCVVDLPALSFISLVGSANVKLTNKQESALEVDDTPGLYNVIGRD